MKNTLRALFAFAFTLSAAAQAPTGGTMTLSRAFAKPDAPVEAAFTGWTDAELPLSYAVQIDDGPASAPVAASAVAFAAPAGEGPHTITGIITDALGNATTVSQVLTVDMTPPVLTLPGYITVQADAPPSVAVEFEVSATDALDPAPVVTVSTPSGSQFLVDVTHLLIATATDAAGNVATDGFLITVERSYAAATVIASTGRERSFPHGVPRDRNNSYDPNLGTLLADAPGYQLARIGVPSLTSLGRVAVTGAATNRSRKLEGILVRKTNPEGASWIMPLRAGGSAGAVGEGLKWKAFPREPFMDYHDDTPPGMFTNPLGRPVQMGFYGRVTGPGVTSANDDVLGFYLLPEVGDEVLAVVAREDGFAPGITGAKFKSFISAAIAAGGWWFDGASLSRAIAFTATLQNGPGGVNRDNDLGLWVWEDGELSLALREGQQIEGRTVRSFETLQAPVGQGYAFTPDGQNYHVPATAGGFTTTVLITFTDGGRRLAVAGSLGTRKLLDENTVAHWVDAGNLHFPWGKFLSWSRSPFGSVVLLTTLTGEPRETDSIIVAETGDADGVVLLRKGDTIEDGSKLTDLAAPVLNAEWTLAVAGKTDRGVSGAWYGSSPLKEFFRVGGAAPGTNGGRWRKLVAYAVPDGMGPIFTAQLLPNWRLGRVTGANDHGLWAVDNAGKTHLVIREGQRLAGKTVRIFQALTYVGGSPAQARSYNGRRDALVRVTAMDNTTHLVLFSIP